MLKLYQGIVYVAIVGIAVHEFRFYEFSSGRKPKMRRVVILALLAMAFSVAASAGTIDIVNQFGSISITSGGITSTQSQLKQFDGVTAPPNQALGTVNFNTGVCLTGCNGAGIPGNSATFSSVGSSFVVTCATAACGGHITLFNGAFTGPITWTLVSQSGQSLVFSLTGQIQGMLNNGQFVSGTTVQTFFTATGQLNEGIGHIRIGNSNLVVPEPGTLSLLGTGLFGIAGMFRRKVLGM